VSPPDEWLGTESLRHRVRFASELLRGVRVPGGGEVVGVVEQPDGEVVGRSELSEGPGRGVEGLGGRGIVLVGEDPRTDAQSLCSQNRRHMPGPVTLQRADQSGDLGLVAHR